MSEPLFILKETGSFKIKPLGLKFPPRFRSTYFQDPGFVRAILFQKFLPSKIFRLLQNSVAELTARKTVFKTHRWNEMEKCWITRAHSFLNRKLGQIKDPVLKNGLGVGYIPKIETTALEKRPLWCLVLQGGKTDVWVGTSHTQKCKRLPHLPP